MGFDLRGKVAIVTGGGRGIGLGISKRLAREGAKVVIAQRSREAGELAVAGIVSEGGIAKFIRTDVSIPQQVADMVDTTIREVGDPDILVNNAAIVAQWAALLECTYEKWQQMLAVNLTGPFLCAKAVAPSMISHGRGKIINIGSVTGLMPEPDCPHYASAKGGLLMLTKSLAYDLGKHNIQSNYIAPGAIATRPGAEDTETGKRCLNKIPMKRRGHIEEIASVVAFVASPQADYINGAVLVVDGGYLIT